jgi:hypothetical protein
MRLVCSRFLAAFRVEFAAVECRVSLWRFSIPMRLLLTARSDENPNRSAINLSLPPVSFHAAMNCASEHKALATFSLSPQFGRQEVFAFDGSAGTLIQRECLANRFFRS